MIDPDWLRMRDFARWAQAAMSARDVNGWRLMQRPMPFVSRRRRKRRGRESARELWRNMRLTASILNFPRRHRELPGP